MILLWLLSLALVRESPAASDWTFVGDILLSREVEKELRLKPGSDPWAEARFGTNTVVFGNLEGAVGSALNCTRPGELCFAIAPERLTFLKQAGFSFLSLENNHGRDTGEKAPAETNDALRKHGLTGITFEGSPHFVRRDGISVAVIAIDVVSRTRPSQAEILRKLRLARRLSDWVVISVHWGTEFLGWANADQKSLARDLVEGGADLVIGHHPHVIQEPECVEGRPVYYSLGNHLFDQRYPSTHTGLAVRCRFDRERFSCERAFTHRTEKSSFPRWTTGKKPGALACEKSVRAKKKTPEIHWHGLSGNDGTSLILLNQAAERLRTSAFALKGFSDFSLPGESHAFFVAHEAYSDFDRKVGLRPAVYSWKGGTLRPLWKGSALAYPVEDMDILKDRQGDYLCALHGEEAHFLGKKVPDSLKVLAYRWNGFGFSRDSEENRQRSCKEWAARFQPGS